MISLDGTALMPALDRYLHDHLEVHSIGINMKNDTEKFAGELP